MKQHQTLTILLFAALIAVQCEQTVGGDCTYREIPGYIAFNKADTAMSRGLRENYYYYWSRFISADYSDTFNYCQVIINVGCINGGTIKLDSLYPCIWRMKISGGCSPGPVKIDAFPDTCYNGDDFDPYARIEDPGRNKKIVLTLKRGTHL